MISFITDDNNDLYLDVVDTGGKAVSGAVLVMADGIEALRQIIVNRVRLQRGEYAYNLNRGIDYMGLLLTDKPLVKLWEEQVLSLVKRIEDVESIRHWNYGLDGNNFIFNLTVNSNYGIVEIKG